jgi:hypothetical protein
MRYAPEMWVLLGYAVATLIAGLLRRAEMARTLVACGLSQQSFEGRFMILIDASLWPLTLLRKLFFKEKRFSVSIPEIAPPPSPNGALRTPLHTPREVLHAPTE